MSDMPEFFNQLIEAMRQRPLDEKWLLAPNRRVGWQWLERAARSGTPAVNAHPKTIRGVALDIAAPHIAQQGLRFLKPLQGVMLTEAAWRRLDPASNYFAGATPDLPFFERLHKSLQELRLAGKQRIEADVLKTPEKADTLNRLLDAYAEECQLRNCIDYADALTLALEAPLTDATPPGLIFLVPDELDLREAERMLIQRIASEQISLSSLSSTGENDNRSPKSDIELLQSVERPGDAPPPKRDGSVELFHAAGESNEVREVFRRCLQSRAPFDQIEIVYTDPAYSSLLYELSFEPDLGEGGGQRLPITFAEGISISYSNPGKALSAWIEWLRNDCSPTRLIALFEEDAIRHEDDAISNQRIAQALRSLPATQSLDITRKRIDSEIQSLKTRIENEEIQNERFDEEDDRESRLKRFSEQIEALEAADNRIDALSDCAPDDNSLQNALDCAMRFLECIARVDDEFDRQSRGVILQECQMLSELASESAPAFHINPFSWLAQLTQSLTVLGEGPKPGCIHVSYLPTGGHAGRPYTFIMGFDDRRFPGAGAQDPIMLDDERQRVSDDLATSARQLRQKRFNGIRLMHQLNGKATFSFSSLNLEDGSEQFASSYFLAIHRLISGDRDDDYSALSQALGLPASFAPLKREACLNLREACMINAAEGLRTPRRWLHGRHPHLGRGAERRRQIDSPMFTEYDGFVQNAGPQLAPGVRHPASASMIETLGRCPLAYFFRYGLGLKEADAIEADEDVWLDPLAFGDLVHGLFEEFIKTLIAKRETVSAERHRGLLMELLEQKIAKYREEFPPKTERSFARQRESLQRCVDIFLASEEELQATHTPHQAEAAIGFKDDSNAPYTITFESGESIPLWGKIDRIDCIKGQENAFALWDYKTGGTYKYVRHPQKKKWDAVQQGRVMQHALYIELARQWLSRRTGTEASVVSFGYFFPSEKGKGERVVYDAKQFTHAKNILFHLHRIASTGACLATTDKDDCSFCPYQPICGDVEAVAERSGEKLSNPENVRLASMKELRTND